jgi:hypothetical protein
MEHFRMLGLIVCAAFFVSCQSAQTAKQTTLEQKQRAALRELQAKPRMNESESNLWNAQQDVLNRGTNPANY